MDKLKKKRIKRYITWALLAVLVAGLAVMPLLAAQEEEETGPKASILSATAQTGNITVAIRGGGTLSAGDTVDVTIPSGVKITEFLVDNGDLITEGTPVARVDTVSVMNAILQVQSSMDTIREQIGDAMDDTIDSSIRAAAGGRVKQVFAQPGDSVRDVMLEHGALAVLSLDSMMAVSVQRQTALSLGDTVCVTLEDGTEVSGRVESSLNGTLTVTVTDNGYGVGEKVILTTEDGDRIGTGELYVHNAWKATGYSGTVQTVYAKEERTVSEGASLFVLTDTDFTGNLDSLSALHREYEQLLQELLQMYETEVITAPGDGIVSGVDADSAFLLSAIEGESGWFVDLLGTQPADRENSWTIMLLSGGTTAVCDGKDTTGKSCEAEEHIKGCYYYCTGTAACTARSGDHKVTCLSLCISAKEENKCLALNHKADCIGKCSSEKTTGVCQSQVHKADCIESCVPTDGTADCPASVHKPECLEHCDKTEACTATAHHYPECVSLCTGLEDCPALNHKEDCYLASLRYYAYAAAVRQVGATELIVAADTVTVYEISTGTKGWELVSPTAIDQTLMITEQTVTPDSTAGYQAGDIILIWTGYNGETPVKTGVAVYAKESSTQPGTGGGTFPGGMGSMDLSGLLGGMSGMGGMTGGLTDQGDTLYDLNGDVLMTITDHSVMKLSITLDEQDIARIYQGQAASVKITALKDEVFDAQVSEVGTEGVNNGGSSKFTVELTLPYREDMLAGMHATATIEEYTKAEVLTLPVAALCQEPGKTLVYTALDPETGEPANPVEVTTGVSDGQNVEILEGLNRSDTVYYSYYDVLELDHTAKASGFSFG